MKYDLLTQITKQNGYIAKMSRVSAMKNASFVKKGLRRFQDGKIFQASQIGEVSLDQLVKRTRDMAGSGVPYAYDLPPARQEARHFIADCGDPLGEYIKCIDQLRVQYPKYIFSGKCIRNEFQTSLSSNYGLDLNSTGVTYDWTIMYQHMESGNLSDGYLYGSSIAPQMSERIQQELEILDSHGKRVSLTQKRIPVLFYEQMTPFKKAIRSLMIQNYMSGASLFADQMGQFVFDARVTLLDRSVDPENGFVQFFDGEGMVRHQPDHVLIKQGQLAGLMSDLRFAHKYQVAPSGNGRRTFDSGVGVAENHICFLGGHQSWRQVFAEHDEAMLIIAAWGGDFNDLGDFSSPVQIGYIYRKGILMGRVNPISIKTSAQKFLGEDLLAMTSNRFGVTGESPGVIGYVDIID
jgi:predicted Zn-dependent protease